MIYWFTGQPGHGKTLHAIARALEFKAQGRAVYVCNVRGFDYGKAGMQPMTPEQFRDWMTFLPDGAVALVDEAYEHDMLPKRPPSAKVPAHVERLATHRHRGIDFIFVCQSPDKQVDGFVHDLIERHIHVRRRFGTKFVHLREFDRYEKNPEKAQPLVLRRTVLPKHVFGLYESTELDTTERRIPWYYFALGIGVPLALGFSYWTFAGMGERLGGGQEVPAVSSGAPSAGQRAGALTERSDGRAPAPVTADQYVASMTPRIPSQPWTAPAFDGKFNLPTEPPRIFCMSSGQQVGQNYKVDSCRCVTEQGTRYKLDTLTCVTIARDGQYEPYRDESGTRQTDGYRMQADARENIRRISDKALPPLDTEEPIPDYGKMRNRDYPTLRADGIRR